MTSKARQLADLGGDTANLEDVSSAYGSGALSNRNLIINGAMQVWQRGTSRTYKQHDYGTVDRFQPGRFQEAAYERVAVSGSGPDAQYALRVSSSSTSEAASGTRMAVGQMVESVNCQHLKGKQVTLSFWVKFSAATFSGYGDFRYEIYEYTDVDPSFGTSTTNTTSESFVTNGSLPTSWTKYTKTITVDSTTNTIAVRMGTDSLGNTTNNGDLYYDITEVQLEVGDTATPFEHRSYGQELALCKRYFQKSYNDGTPVGTATSNGQVNWLTSQQWGTTSIPTGPITQGYVLASPELRATATVVPYSPVTGTANRFYLASTSSDVTPIAWLQQAPSTVHIGYPQNAGGGGFSNTDTVKFHWTADAEL